MRVWFKAGLLLVPVAAVAFGLFAYAPRMRPIRAASAGDFWKAVTGLDTSGRFTGFYLPREGWFIFTVQGWHAEFLYRARGEAVRAALPQWLPRLDSADSSQLHVDVPEALALWKRADPGRADPALLMRFIRQVRLERLRHGRF